MCGLDYDSIAAAIARNNYIDGESLAKVTTEAFINAAPCQGDGDIIAAFRLDEMEPFAQSISSLSGELLDAMEESGRGFAVNNLVSYNKNYWDIKRMAESFMKGDMDLNGASNFQRVKECAQNVLYYRNQAAISVWYGGGYATKEAGGISIAWPEPKEYQSYREFYKKLDFAVDTRWDEVLDRRELGIR